MKKAVVTGANGFIGRALCARLKQLGVFVIALVRDENAESYEGIEFITCDMVDYRRLPQLINDRDIDVVYHLAWMGSSGELRGNYIVQLDNVRYSCDLIEACWKMNCRRLVFPASIMEYELEKVLQTEKEISINSLYSCAKLSADYMLRIMAGKYGVEYLRAVISNVYGPGESSPRLINSTIRKLLRKEACYFSPGEQLYDFIYIDDAVEAFIMIAEKGKSNKTYYIGSEKPRPLKEFISELGRVVDPKAEMGIGKLSFDGVSLNYDEFDLDAVKNDTGFIAKTSFSEGIKNTMKWIRTNENGIY